MHAWILDESPGSYRLGRDRACRSSAADDVRDPRRRQRAEPHGPVGHHGHARSRRCRTCPAATSPASSTAVGAGGHHASRSATRWWSTPASRRWPTSSRCGNDSPMGAGFMIYGEHCWGGHATFAMAPEPQRASRARRAARWEECAAYPLAYLTAYRMLRRARAAGRATRCSSSASARACRAPRWRSARHMGAKVVVTSRSEAKRARGAGDGRRRRARQRRREVAGARPMSWSRASARPRGSNRCVRCKPGGRLVVCGGTSGPKVELNLPRLFFKQYRDHRLARWAATRSSTRCRRSSTQGVAVHVDRTYPLERVRRGARPARARRAARQDRADPRRDLT